MPEISIIVPVYNAELYLSRCLNSIAMQTFEDFEVILINDGSKDKSGEFCDEFSAKDSRFRVIHQINRGVSGARQRGLEAVTGKYIIHADSDDWVESNWLEELYRRAEETESDIVICDFWKDFSKKSEYVSQGLNSYNHHSVLREALIGKLFCYLWNKLIKRSVITSASIDFVSPDLLVYEDVLFICRILNRECKISSVPKGLYHYCYDEVVESLSKEKTRRKYEAKKQVLAELENLVNSQCYNQLFNWKLSILFDSLEYERWGG